MPPLTRTDRDGHHSLTGGLSSETPDSIARLVLDFAKMLAIVGVVCVFVGWLAEGFAPRNAPPVERESGDELRSEEP